MYGSISGRRCGMVGTGRIYLADFILWQFIEDTDMTLDLSEVKKITVQCGASTFQEHWQLHPYKFSFGPSEMLAFAQAIYAMGAAEQKEKDAKICDNLEQEYHCDGEPRNMTYVCAEAIRSQE